MKELQKCFTEEQIYKEMTMEMLTPPLLINTFHERPFYSEWVISLSLIFCSVIVIGIIIEVYRYLTVKERRKSSATDIERYTDNSMV